MIVPVPKKGDLSVCMRQLEENQFAGCHRKSICMHSTGTFAASS